MLDPPPAICAKIQGYPTFCCPDDEKCSATENLQVGYATGVSFADLIRKADKVCQGNSTLTEHDPFCPVPV